MASIKVAAIALALFVVAGILVRGRLGRVSQMETATYSAGAMSDFQKPPAAQLRKKLSTEQFAVTQQCGTEPPFHNAYWDNHKSGIYVDVVSGEPLFSSLDKFDSGTGWPSFTKPLEPGNIRTKT